MQRGHQPKATGIVPGEPPNQGSGGKKDRAVPLATMGEVQEKAGKPSAPLTATLVPYSSVVGQSVSLQDETGRVVALVMISVPSPAFDYKTTATPIAERIVAAFNEGKRQ